MVIAIKNRFFHAGKSSGKRVLFLFSVRLGCPENVRRRGPWGRSRAAGGGMSYAPPPSGSKITGSSSDAGARETTVDGLFQRAKDYTVRSATHRPAKYETLW